MRLFKCIKDHFCAPLERYLHVNNYVYRYDNVAKIAIQDDPVSDSYLNIKLNSIEYNIPAETSWFYDSLLVSPFFEDLGEIPGEDVAGGGLKNVGLGDLMDVEKFIVTQDNIDNKCIVLNIPVVTSDIIFIKIEGAPEQHDGIDYEYCELTNSICWDGFALDGQLLVGDNITVIHSA